MTTWLLERSMEVESGVFECGPSYDVQSDDEIYVHDPEAGAIAGPFVPKLLFPENSIKDDLRRVRLTSDRDEVSHVTDDDILDQASGPELDTGVTAALNQPLKLGTPTVSPESFFGEKSSDEESNDQGASFDDQATDDESSVPTLQEVFTRQEGVEEGEFSEQVVSGGKELDGTSLRDSDLSDTKLESVTFRNVNLRDVDFRGAQLREAEFTGRETRLGGADFTGARLDGATFEVDVADVTFTKAQLRDVDLEKASLEGADFSHARLKRAKLNHSEPTRATFADAVLQDVKTKGAQFEKVSFEGADLFNTTFAETTFEDVDLSDTDLRRATFKKCTLSDVQFVGAKARNITIVNHDTTGLNFERADLSHATLSESNFDSALFDSARASEADFSECDLSGVSLSGARADGATFDGANLEFATLSEADLTDASFEDTRLYACQLISARVGGGTNFDDVYSYPGTDETTSGAKSGEHSGRRAASVYRTLEAVYRNNSLTSESLRYLRRRKDEMLTVNRDEGQWPSVVVDGFLRITTAHGTRVRPLLISSAGFVVLTAVIHYVLGTITRSSMGRLWLWGMESGLLAGFAQTLLFSLLTFTGLGYGRFSRISPVGEALAVIQSGGGVVVFGLLIFVFSTRASR